MSVRESAFASGAARGTGAAAAQAAPIGYAPTAAALRQHCVGSGVPASVGATGPGPWGRPAGGCSGGDAIKHMSMPGGTEGRAPPGWPNTPPQPEVEQTAPGQKQNQQQQQTQKAQAAAVPPSDAFDVATPFPTLPRVRTRIGGPRPPSPPSPAPAVAGSSDPNVCLVPAATRTLVQPPQGLLFPQQPERAQLPGLGRCRSEPPAPGSATSEADAQEPPRAELGQLLMFSSTRSARLLHASHRESGALFSIIARASSFNAALDRASVRRSGADGGNRGGRWPRLAAAATLPAQLAAPLGPTKRADALAQVVALERLRRHALQAHGDGGRSAGGGGHSASGHSASGHSASGHSDSVARWGTRPRVSLGPPDALQLKFEALKRRLSASSTPGAGAAAAADEWCALMAGCTRLGRLCTAPAHGRGVLRRRFRRRCFSGTATMTAGSPLHGRVSPLPPGARAQPSATGTAPLSLEQRSALLQRLEQMEASREERALALWNARRVLLQGSSLHSTAASSPGGTRRSGGSRHSMGLRLHLVRRSSHSRPGSPAAAVVERRVPPSPPSHQHLLSAPATPEPARQKLGPGEDPLSASPAVTDATSSAGTDSTVHTAASCSSSSGSAASTTGAAAVSGMRNRLAARQHSMLRASAVARLRACAAAAAFVPPASQSGCSGAAGFASIATASSGSVVGGANGSAGSSHSAAAPSCGPRAPTDVAPPLPNASSCVPRSFVLALGLEEGDGPPPRAREEAPVGASDGYWSLIEAGVAACRRCGSVPGSARSAIGASPVLSNVCAAGMARLARSSSAPTAASNATPSLPVAVAATAAAAAAAAAATPPPRPQPPLPGPTGIKAAAVPPRFLQPPPQRSSSVNHPEHQSPAPGQRLSFGSTTSASTNLSRSSSGAKSSGADSSGEALGLARAPSLGASSCVSSGARAAPGAAALRRAHSDFKVDLCLVCSAHAPEVVFLHAASVHRWGSGRCFAIDTGTRVWEGV
jgi:hypothetical protein